ncbi:pre-B-cell leukemia homeobox interacting protein 1b isoform X2 [Neoarius graeffei]|uniref:pre-B-cell leukemia homeobox interacting protein 1b isoform X2 n=1 Tax=Neoarius graeffei TaxID=443677 RepID=UPI00298CE4E3|nr:pre-B-cell leukemia homeobox interacting protein 1b isoform X2 [Neoarius graeffei]
MADNSGTNGNSWTILAPEVKESGVESMGPLSEGQGELHGEPTLNQSSALPDTPSEQTHPPDPPQVTPLESSDDAAVLHSTIVKEDTTSRIPTHVENLTSLTPDPREQEASDDASANQPLIDTESFSDSYTHISPSLVSASLPGASDEEEEGLLEGEEKGELRKTPREDYKPEEKVNEGDGLRRRNVSVLTPLYHRDEEEEEEEGEEQQFRHPQRGGEGDIGFTLNKCIFGALLLLGLGTIFFSEGDADAKDLKYSEVKKEWLNPDAQGDTSGGVQPPEILDKLAKENQQIASLQAQIQEQEAELKAAQLQVEEGTKERLRREELEAENQKIRGELDKLPALQKEYEQESERVKKESERVNKELEALPAMQKELEHLREKVTELSQSTVNVQAMTPSAGHEELPVSQERKGRKDKKAWDKEKKEKDPRTEEKEWKKEKNIKVDEQDGKGKRTKDHKEWEKEDGKQGKGKGEGKRGQKDHKQGDAQRWKLDGEKRELKERSGKREWKEDKKWEKEKPGEFVDKRGEKREKGKEDKEWKQKSEQKDWKEEKEWKKGKQAIRHDKERKEKSEKQKDWKERKEWGDEREKGASGDEKYSDKSQKEKTRKDKKDHHNRNSERKEREGKHWSGKEKDKPKSGERTEGRKDKNYKDKNHKKEEKLSRKGKHEASHHSYSDQKHSRDHVHVNYWAEQRAKIRHYYGSTEGCADVTACAHAEGLTPVSQRDFEAFFSGYLTKLLGDEDQTSRKEELSKLIGEFFTDGIFIHDQIPFSEFVEDVEDILEDLADGDDDDDDEMEGFAAEAMEKFVLREKEGNEEKRGGSGRKRVKG